MASRYSSYKTRICGTAFQTWCITACEEYKNQSSPAVTNGSWEEQTIYLYLMQQWKLKWIHTAQQTHRILKPQPASAAGLTRIETAHQEGLLFATILSSCMCEWEGSCCSFALILFVKLSTVAVWNFSDQTNKHVFVHSRFCPSVTLSLCASWVWQCFHTLAPQRVRRHVPIGRNIVLCSHSAQCWWQGYGCYHGWVVLVANNTADAPWLLDRSNYQQTSLCYVEQ